eukprot:388479-Pyramimonas_sp.AAC.1
MARCTIYGNPGAGGFVELQYPPVTKSSIEVIAEHYDACKTGPVPRAVFTCSVLGVTMRLRNTGDPNARHAIEGDPGLFVIDDYPEPKKRKGPAPGKKALPALPPLAVAALMDDDLDEAAGAGELEYEKEEFEAHEKDEGDLSAAAEKKAADGEIDEDVLDHAHMVDPDIPAPDDGDECYDAHMHFELAKAFLDAGGPDALGGVADAGDGDPAAPHGGGDEPPAADAAPAGPAAAHPAADDSHGDHHGGSGGGHLPAPPPPFMDPVAREALDQWSAAVRLSRDIFRERFHAVAN